MSYLADEIFTFKNKLSIGEIFEIILQKKILQGFQQNFPRRNSYLILKFYNSFVQILLEIKFLLTFSFIPNCVQENIIFMGKIIFLLEFVLGKYLT